MESNQVPQNQPSNSPAPQQSAPPAQPVSSPQSQSTGSGFAIAALVLGIIAFVFGWAGAFNILTGVLAVVFAIVALKKGQSKGMSITGLILGGIGLLTSLVFAAIFFAALASSGDTVKTDSSDSQSETKSSESPAKWDLNAAYDKIQNGMTKAEVEEATGKESSSCSTSESETLGKYESCTYGNMFTDGGSISVGYDNNGAVSNKYKYEN